MLKMLTLHTSGKQPLRIAFPRGRHGCIQLRKYSRDGLPKLVADFFERCRGRPAGMSRGLNRTTGVQVEARLVSQSFRSLRRWIVSAFGGRRRIVDAVPAACAGCAAIRDRAVIMNKPATNPTEKSPATDVMSKPRKPGLRALFIDCLVGCQCLVRPLGIREWGT